MGEELICGMSGYRRRFPKPISYVALLFTSKRLIVAKALPSWIESSPFYAQGASYFLMKNALEKHREKLKTLPFDEVLSIDKENFEIPYSNIREVSLHRRFPEYKLTIKMNGKEHRYGLLVKKNVITASINPLLLSVFGDKFKTRL